MATFWAILEGNSAIFIPACGHTDQEPNYKPFVQNYRLSIHRSLGKKFCDIGPRVHHVPTDLPTRLCATKCPLSRKMSLVTL